MPGPDLPEVPAQLKGIQHYLKIASEHDQRDPVVSYWARLYSLQTGLKISTKTPAENNFLMKLMDWLEATKKSLIDNEAITNEVAAQAHLENWALKLFLYADKNDREGTFNKSVIQSFYTAGLLYDILTTFGELTEEAMQNRKYAKWKAAYIHNCLKNGETPVPGPMKTEGEDDDNSNFDVGPGPDEDLLLDVGGDDEPVQADHGQDDNQADETLAKPEGEVAEPEEDANQAGEPSAKPEGETTEPEQVEGEDSEPGVDSEPNETGEPSTEPEADTVVPEQAEEGPSEPGIDPAPVQPTPPPNTDAYGFPSVPSSTTPQPPNNTPYPGLPTPVTPNSYNPTPTSTNPSIPSDFSTTPKSTEGATLSPEQMLKAGKYIKWAGSAINYDDVPTAIDNLQKALHLLTTGEDS